jgi:hypothetical protein
MSENTKKARKGKIRQRKTVVFYIGLLVALFAILSGLAYYFYDYGDKTFADLATIHMVVGGLLYIGLVGFTRFKFAPMVPAAMYIVGFAEALAATLPSLSDVWNGVNFIGGFAYMGLFFTIQFAVCAVLSIVGAFMNYNKPKKNHSKGA